MKIKSLRKLNSHPTTYDLCIEGNHNYFVSKDDLLVHNSGKDFTKVDRSGCYAARYVAKNIVAAGLARKCEVQVSYAIGVPEPVSIMVDTFNTGLLEDSRLADIVNVVFDLTPRGIIDSFNLKYFDFTCVSNYGHFGRLDLDLPWERTDKVDQLSSYLY